MAVDLEIAHAVLRQERQQSIAGADAVCPGRGLRLRRVAGADGVRDPAVLGGRGRRQRPQVQREEPRAMGLVAHRGGDAGQPPVAAALGQKLVEALVGGGPVQQLPALERLLHPRCLLLERIRGRARQPRPAGPPASAAAMPSTAISTS